MATIYGQGLPDKSTIGEIGDTYVDTNTGLNYSCVDVTTIKKYKKIEVIYEWDPVVKIADDPVPECNMSTGYLVSDEFGNPKWEDKILHKSNRSMIKLNSETAIDRGEGYPNGRYHSVINVGELGHKLYTLWGPTVEPWTLYFDGASITYFQRRLPIINTKPMSGVEHIQIYQHGSEVRIDIGYDEPGEHIFVFEAGGDMYSQLDYGFMPHGYPKIEFKEVSLVNRTSMNGTLFDNGQTYCTAIIGLSLKTDCGYKMFFSNSTSDSTRYSAKSSSSDDKIIIGDGTKSYNNIPFYLEYDEIASNTTLYWDSSLGQKVYFGISEEVEEVITIDDMFIPNTIQRVGDELIISSSTEGSIKKFKLTVDDGGTISAIEIIT